MDVRGVSEAWHENERSHIGSLRPCPLQNLELHIRIDGHEPGRVRRWVFPRGLRCSPNERQGKRLPLTPGAIDGVAVSRDRAAVVATYGRNRKLERRSL